MSISPLALAAKKVIDAAFVNGPAYDLASVAAFALESACLLQDPETAAEHDVAVETARHAVAVAESSVAMMRREHAENARLRERIAELEAGPALPWAHAMSDHDLHGFLDQLLSAAIGRWQHSPEVPDRVTLAEIEKVCALWRTPGEGNRLDGSEFDGAVVQLAPQARTGPEQGACTECGDGPSKWCGGCAKCSCEPEHDKGCVKASALR